MAFVESIENMVMFFVVCIVVFVCVFALTTIKNDSTIDSTLFAQTAAGTTAKSNMSAFSDRMDTALLMGWLALHIGVILLAFIFRSHPIFYIIGIMVSLILVWLAPILSNTWDTVVSANGFEATVTAFPKVSLIMDKLPLLEVVWAFVTAAIMFGLSRYEGII